MLKKPPRPRLLKRAVVAAVAMTMLGVSAGTATAQGAVASPLSSHANDSACTSLASTALADHDVLTATSQVVAATSALPAYCEVNLEERPAINIEVGLPLNTKDGGTGGSA